jgi:hypothetical protein
MRGSSGCGVGVIRWAALIGVLVLAGCNPDQKYHLPPPDPTLAYPRFKPAAPPPEPVLDPAAQAAATRSLERSRQRLNSIPPAKVAPMRPGGAGSR